jgi:hypothetical protein
MKYITSILRRLFVTEEKKVLGRWSIEHCDKKMNSKIDLSNEDHCGPCGQYALDKMCNTIISNNNNNTAITKVGPKSITKYTKSTTDFVL